MKLYKSISNSSYEFAAFISYKSDDEKWAEWLQNQLETYRLPSILCKSNPSLPKKIGRCFRYHTDIQPNGCLTEELILNLKKSRYLLVVSSPRSAKSMWVGQEVLYFDELGRRDHIIPVIVDGIPYSDNPEKECLHPVLRQIFPKTDNPETDEEVLCVNINESGSGSILYKRRRAVVQLVSTLLGISFDTLWNRDLHRRRRRLIGYAAIFLSVLLCACLLWSQAKPYDYVIHLHDLCQNDNLPSLSGATVELIIQDEVRRDSIYSLPARVVFRNLPSRYKRNSLGIRVMPHSEDYCPIDTLASGENISLQLSRNINYYGDIRFRIWDVGNESTIPFAKGTVGGIPFVSDATGQVEMAIPLSKQSFSYKICVSGVNTLDSLLYTPNGPGAVILVD